MSWGGDQIVEHAEMVDATSESRSGPYAVLNISPPPAAAVSSAEEVEWQKQLKLAYQHALRRYHPDKIPVSTVVPPRYTVDQVRAAYEILSSSDRRAALQSRLDSCEQAEGLGYGIEALDRIDLGDMRYCPPGEVALPVSALGTVLEHRSEVGGIFYTTCPRCRTDTGILISEDELVARVNDGEHQRDQSVVVSCQGCSLRVVVEYEDTQA